MDAIEELEEHINFRETTLAEAMEKYQVIGAHHDPALGSYIIMADRSPQITDELAMRELGYASPSPWTSWTREERVPELMGKIGLRTYYDMKRADGTVRGALRLLKTPILAARWFVEPASDSTIDKNVAEFVEKNLFEELSVPWSRVVEDALLMCEYGYMPFELVFEPKDGKLKLQKLAPRHPMDIMEWLWDVNGGINGLIMENVQGFGGAYDNLDLGSVAPPPNSFSSNGTGYNSIDFQGEQTYQPRVFIPIEKMVVFSIEQEAGDLRGISILRSAYKHYYYKDTLYKIDAIQKERHGIGVPIIKLPPGFSESDRKLAEDLGRNLRTNERAHIVVPSNWEIQFAKLEGQPVDCMGSIEHHDMKIKSNILAPFMDESNVKPESLDVYYKSTRYIASTICDTFNHFVIPKIVTINFNRGGLPKLRVRRIGEWEDIRTMSFAFRNFVGAGAIIPDDDLEKFFRSELDLPPADPKTARTISTPQLDVGKGGQEALAGSYQAQQAIATGTAGGPNVPAPPTAPTPGPPRQSTSAPVGVGKSNTGRDTSGGRKK